MYTIDRDSVYYPSLLRQISSNPRELFCEGKLELIRYPMVSIVGTRSMTKYGSSVLSEILHPSIAKLDICIASGLALGVDAKVHELCLERGIKTVAVVPGSLESNVPKRNLVIYDLLRKRGLVMAEFSKPCRLGNERYVLRNRVLAAISMATIVIEAGVVSGSLITAKYALEFDRDLYAIPGSVFSEYSKGCNFLIQQGAGVILSKEDFLALLMGINNQLYLHI